MKSEREKNEARIIRQQAYLSMKPSQVASAPLLFSINLCQSDVASLMGLKKFENLNLNTLFFENVMNIEIMLLFIGLGLVFGSL